ncbi:hypothetical protein ABIE64_002642 [Thalassospira sp. MBR-102]|uniref:hypothetical protein n=1 Tax=Thalassospira sp. MBR-102 TaxID=3156466 RepID=UPI003398775D
MTDAEREEIEALVEAAEQPYWVVSRPDMTPQERAKAYAERERKMAKWKQGRNRLIERMQKALKRVLDNPKHFEVWSNK